MITLITGPMKCGKSTELFRRMERAHIAGKKILYICPKKSERDFFARGIPWKAVMDIVSPSILEDWEDIEEYTLRSWVLQYDLIVIDEFFMLKHNERFIKTALRCPTTERRADIVFGGLLADANAVLWPEATTVLPYCDEIIKLSAVCEHCGSELGTFSYTDMTIKPGEVIVGDSEYKVLCGPCYFKAKH